MTRYTFEVKTKKDQDELDKFLINRKIDEVDKYDAVEKLSKEVERMGQSLRQFEASGVDWDVFETYLKGKGHSRENIRGVMGDVKEFFIKIGLLSNEE